MRSIVVRQGERTVSIPVPEPSAGTEEISVLALLAESPDIFVAAPCGGAGRCGKCLVRVVGTHPQHTESNAPGSSVPSTTVPGRSASDTCFLSPEQLDAGYRLACTCPVTAITEVIVPPRDGSAFVKNRIPRFDTPARVSAAVRAEGPFAVAIDIGTTTVAAYLLDTATGEVVTVVSQMNRQALYGADVLSRISYTEKVDGGLERLTCVIRAQLREMIGELAGAVDVGPVDVGTIGVGTVVVAGNTTMLHLLAGVSPAGIGRAPFTPAFTGCRRLATDDLALGNAGTAILLPSIAAYVGADIVSAAVAVDMDTDARTTLLVDVGTNGEIALNRNGTIFTCATAAGPAFEGATISSGVGGVAGALSSWEYRDGRFVFATINDDPVLGICGSGLLDLLATLVTDGIVDETGRMASVGALPTGNAWKAMHTTVDDAPAISYAGDLLFTQKDVREVQLAKAAIAAGIDVLCAEAGIETADIERLVLTGGFGSRLRVTSAVVIGLLPKLPPERIITVDNAAGRGAVAVIRIDDTLERMKHVALHAHYIELSGHTLFQERYVEQMFFPE